MNCAMRIPPWDQANQSIDRILSQSRPEDTIAALVSEFDRWKGKAEEKVYLTALAARVRMTNAIQKSLDR